MSLETTAMNDKMIKKIEFSVHLGLLLIIAYLLIKSMIYTFYYAQSFTAIKWFILTSTYLFVGMYISDIKQDIKNQKISDITKYFIGKTYHTAFITLLLLFANVIIQLNPDAIASIQL